MKDGAGLCERSTNSFRPSPSLSLGARIRNWQGNKQGWQTGLFGLGGDFKQSESECPQAAPAFPCSSMFLRLLSYYNCLRPEVKLLSALG